MFLAPGGSMGWSGFSPKCLFTEAAFHRTSFSPKGRLFLFGTVHQIYREYIEHSKTGLRSSLAPLEAELETLKVFAISSHHLLEAT